MPAVAAHYPNENQADSPKIRIRVSVPEEFLGYAISELTARRGHIEAIEGRDPPWVLATMPARELAGFTDELERFTGRRFKIEVLHDDNKPPTRDTSK